MLAARERAEYEAAESLYLDELARDDPAEVRRRSCAYCGAAIEWGGEKGWQIRGTSQPCRQTPAGRHHVGGDEEHPYGLSLAERAELVGTEITECPGCGMASVLHVPGLYPVCQCCDWTGWERDEVPESARPR
ncbi:MAG: hypothetical protein ACYCTE_15625 [Acidimicrobiales bacterium]